MRDICIITGLTGSGKSALSVDYAKKCENVHIINADASQLYDELKILTAFPKKDEMDNIPHHLFGVLLPLKKPSVAEWVNMADDTIASLSSNAKVILCGGTGFYLDAFLHGIAEIPSIPNDFRLMVQQKFNQLGRDAFFAELQKIDPDTTLHPNNTQRVLRAYEVVAFTGKPLQYWWNSSPKRNIKAKMLVIIPPRSELRRRCEIRINRMLSDGLIDEVQDFISRYPDYSGGLCSAIGYREAVSVVQKKISENEFRSSVLTRTMQYAKRQSTWFRNKFPEAYFVEDTKEGKSFLENN